MDFELRVEDGWRIALKCIIREYRLNVIKVKIKLFGGIGDYNSFTHRSCVKVYSLVFAQLTLPTLLQCLRVHSILEPVVGLW